MKTPVLLLTLGGLVACGSLAYADTLYQATSQTGSRFNPNAGEVGGTTFDDVFIPIDPWKNAIKLDRVTFGVRRGPNANGTLVPVTGELFAGLMTGSGPGLGSPLYSLGTFSLGATPSAGFVTQLITVSPGTTVPLNTTFAPGLGGLWLGMTFNGPNALDALNGWRIVNAPSIGSSMDVFGYTSPVDPFSLFFFGGSPVADFYLQIDGATVPEPGPIAAFAFVGALGAARFYLKRRAAKQAA